MTWTAKLQGKMREKGYSLARLAETIGISATGLFNKVHNQQEFLASEIQVVGEVLDLSQQETHEIFFRKKVE